MSGRLFAGTLAASALMVACSGEAETPSESGSDATTASAESTPEPSDRAGVTEPSSRADTAAATDLPSGDAGFVVTVDGVRYVSDAHQCFELGDGALAVSGEGSGPSGPFQFFVQAGLEEELSFEAGAFAVSALPDDTDLAFQQNDGSLRGSVTLDGDGVVLVVEGRCEPASEDVVPAPSGENPDGADLLQSTQGMSATFDDRTYTIENYGCSQTATGVAITGSAFVEDDLFVTLYIESGRDVASVSVSDGTEFFAAGYTDQGTISLAEDGNTITVDAVAQTGERFSMAVIVCDDF